jgi:hypothetical protein
VRGEAFSAPKQTRSGKKEKEEKFLHFFEH